MHTGRRNNALLVGTHMMLHTLLSASRNHAHACRRRYTVACTYGCLQYAGLQYGCLQYGCLHIRLLAQTAACTYCCTLLHALTRHTLAAHCCMHSHVTHSLHTAARKTHDAACLTYAFHAVAAACRPLQLLIPLCTRSSRPHPPYFRQPNRSTTRPQCANCVPPRSSINNASSALVVEGSLCRRLAEASRHLEI